MMTRISKGATKRAAKRAKAKAKDKPTVSGDFVMQDGPMAGSTCYWQVSTSPKQKGRRA